MNDFDFQIQTTASDGAHTPMECVKIAKKNGVRTIAITDHDTVGGVAEALKAGEELGVRVISGIEISAEDHNLHMLGLGVDHLNQELVETTERMAREREEGAKEMVKRFQDDGFQVSWDVVRAKAKGTVARPHIVEAIMENPANKSKLGGVTTKHDFFSKFFQDDSKYYVHRTHISAADAIALIHHAGGLAVWSHPPIPDFVEKLVELAAFLAVLVAAGLDGLEAFGSFALASDVDHLILIAKQHRLIITGGSDFHQAYDPHGAPWPRSSATIGEFPVYGRDVSGILPAFDAAFVAIRSKAR